VLRTSFFSIYLADQYGGGGGRHNVHDFPLQQFNLKKKLYAMCVLLAFMYQILFFFFICLV